MPDLSWRGGFSTLESSPQLDWRWSSQTGELRITNWSSGVRRVRIEMTLMLAQPAPAALRIESPFFSADLTIAPEGTPFSRALALLPGKQVIHFVCDGRIIRAPGDPRPLVFKVVDFRMISLD